MMVAVVAVCGGHDTSVLVQSVCSNLKCVCLHVFVVKWLMCYGYLIDNLKVESLNLVKVRYILLLIVMT